MIRRIQVLEVLSNPFIDIGILILLFIMLILVLKGRVAEIGTKGIVFNNGEDEHFKRLQEMFDRHEAVVTGAINDLKKEDIKINDTLINVTDDINRLRVGQMKQEILNPATPWEKKLEIYDAYQKMGYNSYIKLYMEQEIKKHAGTQS